MFLHFFDLLSYLCTIIYKRQLPCFLYYSLESTFFSYQFSLFRSCFYTLLPEIFDDLRRGTSAEGFHFQYK